MFMRIELDVTRCTGHGRCYERAPAVFDCDESGHGVLLRTEVPEDLAAPVRDAAQTCPERAITVR